MRTPSEIAREAAHIREMTTGLTIHLPSLTGELATKIGRLICAGIARVGWVVDRRGRLLAIDVANVRSTVWQKHREIYNGMPWRVAARSTWSEPSSEQVTT